jgi:hypothetical protein
MDVYLVPIGRDRYECYYEAPDDEDEEPEETAPGTTPGFFKRMLITFNRQLREAEQSRFEKTIEAPTTYLGRVHRRSLRFIAERMAEQRLLWHLRRAHAATLHIPVDLPAATADQIMRLSMKRDAERHRNRLIPHTIALAIAGLVAFVPGPNVLGYLFTFTVVGHFLSWRGAAHALSGVRWTVQPSRDLSDLQRALLLDVEARRQLIAEVADRLHLPRMARFVERMAT